PRDAGPGEPGLRGDRRFPDVPPGGDVSMMGPGGNPAKTRAADFRGTAGRILRMLRADRSRILGIVLLAVLSAASMLAIPLILGQATDRVIEGVREGGVDYASLARLLGLGAGLAAASWLVTVGMGRTIAGLAQRMAYELRESADAKVAALPLRYFDSRSRGEVLSTVTNDIDNLTQTVQQVFQRIVFSLLMLLGVPLMMLTISPLLTSVVLLTVPVTLWGAKASGKRAQPRFGRQWAATGKVNGHVEEMITGHQLVTVFGRREESVATFKRHNDELYTASAGAQFLSGLIAPALGFLGSVTYVLVAVIGGLRVASGAISIG